MNGFPKEEYINFRHLDEIDFWAGRFGCTVAELTTCANDINSNSVYLISVCLSKKQLLTKQYDGELPRRVVELRERTVRIQDKMGELYQLFTECPVCGAQNPPAIGIKSRQVDGGRFVLHASCSECQSQIGWILFRP